MEAVRTHRIEFSASAACSAQRPRPTSQCAAAAKASAASRSAKLRPPQRLAGQRIHTRFDRFACTKQKLVDRGAVRAIACAFPLEQWP
jgi:hypothetical protein